MDTSTIFMIIGDSIKYLDNPTVGHSDWYDELGLDRSNYQNTVIGAVVDNKIVFYKSDFSYNDEVINCAKRFGLDVMRHINNYDHKVCCGVLLGKQRGDWEPIYILNDKDIEGYIVKEKAKTRFEKGNDNNLEKKALEENKTNNNEQIELGREVVDFKNDLEDPNFIKRAIKTTLIVLILNIIITIAWISIWPIHNSSVTSFCLFISTLLLIVSIILFKNKSNSVKVTGLISSILIAFNFNFLSIVLGLYYFIFIVDENIIRNVVINIKKLINKKK